MSNPFSEGSTSFTDFETMSDLQWHCTKCELKSAQAKTWQVWRQEKGIQLDTDIKGNFYKKKFCNICNQKTIHRKLKSLKILDETKVRAGISIKLAKRIKEIYKYEEAVFLRKLSSRELEVDHKFPQIRWAGDEDKNINEMTESEIKSKFILLRRSNNLLKSRYCETCIQTGERGCFPGIYFWYEGKEHWDKKFSKTDKQGCVGCFWFDPYKWRNVLNKIIK